MGFSDWLELAGKIVLPLVPLIAGVRWFLRWRRGREREEEQMLDSLQQQLAERGGAAPSIQPEVGSRDHRTAERLAVKGQLKRVGTGYRLPQ